MPNQALSSAIKKKDFYCGTSVKARTFEPAVDIYNKRWIIRLIIQTKFMSQKWSKKTLKKLWGICKNTVTELCCKVGYELCYWMLRRIFWLRRSKQQEAGENCILRRSLPNVIEVIKQRMTKRTGYVHCIWEKRNVYRLLVDKPEEETGLRRPICQWRIILK